MFRPDLKQFIGGILLICLMPVAWSLTTSSEFNGNPDTDSSTYTPISKSTSATASAPNRPANAPFQLTEGLYNPKTDTNILYNCSGMTSTSAAFCIVRLTYPKAGATGPDYIKKLCPAGFTPRLDIEPVNAVVQQERIFACASGEPVPNTAKTEYRMSIKVSGISTDNSSIIPGTGASWKIMCYPDHGARAPASYYDCEREPQYSKSILLLEMGYRDLAYSTTSTQPNFIYTDRACPKNYIPYVMLMNEGSRGRFDQYGFDAQGSGGICVDSVLENTSWRGIEGYTIQYRVLNNTVRIGFTEGLLIIKPPTPHEITFIQWRVYCIPPNSPAAGDRLEYPYKSPYGTYNQRTSNPACSASTNTNSYLKSSD